VDRGKVKYEGERKNKKEKRKRKEGKSNSIIDISLFTQSGKVVLSSVSLKLIQFHQ
jgi:hypothetical protein